MITTTVHVINVNEVPLHSSKVETRSILRMVRMIENEYVPVHFVLIA